MHSTAENSEQSELIISSNYISKCYNFLSNENLCWLHSESVKTTLINDVQNQIIELSLINQ